MNSIRLHTRKPNLKKMTSIGYNKVDTKSVLQEWRTDRLQLNVLEMCKLALKWCKSLIQLIRM